MTGSPTSGKQLVQGTTLHYSMSKDHVYSWRLRGDLKAALGEAARDEKVSVADHDDFETYRAGRRRFRIEPGRWHR